MRDYTELVAWQKAMDLVEVIYQNTASFPKEEVYGLRSQIRRAAISVPSNIAEGQGRLQKNSFLNHLSIAHGSLREVECQIRIAARLGYLESDKLKLLMEICSEVGRLLSGLFKALRRVDSKQLTADG